MIHKNGSPAPEGNLGRAEFGFCNGVMPDNTPKLSDAATDFPALYLARRYRLPLSMARIVAGLAQIGERAT